MRGSAHRYLTAAKLTVAGAVLAGAVAVAGCGGGSGNKNAVPPPSAAPSAAGPVTAVGTKGLVGPAARATDQGTQAQDRKLRIPGTANQVPKLHGHAVAGTESCGGDITPDDSNIAQLNAAIICLVNAERAAAGLGPLSESSQLDQAAVGMGQLMVKEQFFSHETPEGKNVVDRIQPTGYIPSNSDWVVGENLAWGNGSLSTPNAIVNGWMNSPGHRANILAPDYKDIGLAAVMGSPSPNFEGGTVYVNEFGAKSGADPNVKLPAEGGSASTSPSAKVASARSKHRAKRKHKRRHRHHRRHR